MILIRNAMEGKGIYQIFYRSADLDLGYPRAWFHNDVFYGSRLDIECYLLEYFHKVMVLGHTDLIDNILKPAKTYLFI